MSTRIETHATWHPGEDDATIRDLAQRVARLQRLHHAGIAYMHDGDTSAKSRDYFDALEDCQRHGDLEATDAE